jgi:ribosomal protein S18 acetylase RimI-like enzyme
MEIKLIPSDEKSKYDSRVFEILTNADNEFVPPLSSRRSTTQSDLCGGEKAKDGIKKYFEEMKKQCLMLAFDGERVTAFMSFKENYTTEIITDTPNVYLSTLVVAPEGRGAGLTQKMYEKLFSLYPDAFVFTRTWSTNAAHTKILARLDFEAFKTIKNDRGEGIDTVYFIRRPKTEN